MLADKIADAVTVVHFRVPCLGNFTVEQHAWGDAGFLHHLIIDAHGAEMLQGQGRKHIHNNQQNRQGKAEANHSCEG